MYPGGYPAGRARELEGWGKEKEVEKEKLGGGGHMRQRGGLSEASPPHPTSRLTSLVSAQWADEHIQLALTRHTCSPGHPSPLSSHLISREVLVCMSHADWAGVLCQVLRSLLASATSQSCFSEC